MKQTVWIVAIALIVLAGALAVSRDNNPPPGLGNALQRVQALREHPTVAFDSPQLTSAEIPAAPGGAAPTRVPSTFEVRVSTVFRRLLGKPFETLFEFEYPELDLVSLRSDDEAAVTAVLEGEVAAALVTGSRQHKFKTLGLRSLVLGHRIPVLVVKQENSLKSITTEQLSALLLGKTQTWQEVSFDSGALRVCGQERNEVSLRAERIFLPDSWLPVDTLRERSPRAVLDRVVEQNALGILSLIETSQSERVRSLKILGVAPSIDSFERGRYPYGYSLMVVYRDPPKHDSALANLIRFAKSRAAGRLLGEILIR